MRSRASTIIGILFAGALAAGGCGPPPPTAPGPGPLLKAPPTDRTYEVIRIIDGDTIEIAIPCHGWRLAQPVRLLGIDAPEKGEPGYEVAADALRKKLLHRRVTLDYGGRRPRYSFHRLLAAIAHKEK